MLKTIAIVAGLQFASTHVLVLAQTFSADAAAAAEETSTGQAGSEAGAENTAALEPVDDIRDISDEFCADGNAKSAAGLSNMVWSFGQFVDHDLALSLDNERSPTIAVETATDVMELHRFVTSNRRGCRNSLNVHTPIIDAGPIYGSDEQYLQGTLREPDTCFMRSAEGGFLPLTTAADDTGRFRFLAGDVRVSENAFLATMHIVWLREHNRLCDAVNADPANARMSEDAKFDLVRDVVIAKFQQVVLTEFLPALGITQRDLETAEGMVRSSGISVEFSIAYRLGHDLIGNDVGGIDLTGAFNAEDFYTQMEGSADTPSVTYKDNAESSVANVMAALSTSTANEIDGRLSDALRNFLFGRSEGQDLAGRNIFRSRELGLPTYAGMAECFGITPDATIEAETPDAWLGLLREPKAAGTVLPPTLRAVLVEQFHRSFFGPRGFYWRTIPRRVGRFLSEVESSTFARIITANSNARVSGNVFKA
eukprot:jgi/Ulvmu1/3592/UM017_0004.1